MEKNTADELLRWTGKKNPGKWIEHSYNVARAAETIAKECSLDCNHAYVLGLLHDIGRCEGGGKLKHIVSGYNMLIQKGHNDIARACLTHSFPHKDSRAVHVYTDDSGCTQDEINFIKSELEKCVYDDYDKLIQLCDGICDDKGITLLEIRFMDGIRRNGFNDCTVKNLEALFAIKDYFEGKCGKKLYELFRGEIINTIFGI
ncbi:MAG: HD domain-containing protein [Treponema sp.]|nr:HD domain-containing protein [Treponema sp.]